MLRLLLMILILKFALPSSLMAIGNHGVEPKAPSKKQDDNISEPLKETSINLNDNKGSDSDTENENTNKIGAVQQSVIHPNNIKNEEKVTEVQEHVLKTTISPQTNTVNIIPNAPKFQKDVHSGALLRGFYVLIGLSALTLMYFMFRSYRVRHNNQSSAVVKKYGVTARRNDLEMRRLELEEDDDETIFETGQQSVMNK